MKLLPPAWHHEMMAMTGNDDCRSFLPFSEHLLGARPGAAHPAGITSFWPRDCETWLLFLQFIDE